MTNSLDSGVDAFAKVEYADLDYDAFETRPLRNPTLRSLRYLFDVERHNIWYLRDLLVTPTHKDAAVTAFLTRWAFEGFWHGEAVSKLLGTHGIVIDNALIQRMRTSLGWRDSLAPVYRSALANMIGDDITGVHMAWGAINEWTAQAAYRRLGELDDHPVLAELLGRILEQRARHIDFYVSQAQQRLRRSARARRLTRLALDRLWGPPGSTIHPRQETSLVFGYLFGGTGSHLIAGIDDEVSALPGLEGRRVAEVAFGRYGVGPQAGRRPSLVERMRVAVPSARRRGLHL